MKTQDNIENNQEWIASYDRVCRERDLMNRENERLTVRIRDLEHACGYALDILSKIPAFGDSIGTEVSKSQLGIAHNKLGLALHATSLNSY